MKFSRSLIIGIIISTGLVLIAFQFFIYNSTGISIGISEVVSV